MILAVQPIGTAAESSVPEVLQCIADHFGFETRVEPAWPDPDYAWDNRRRQYNSFEIMRSLAREPFGGADRVLAVTACDLFIPALTFVFGQAQLDGRIALVSTARLRQGFYGITEDDALFRLRLRKEVSHELGHTLGLIHCSVPYCTMRLSTGILQVDVKEDRFCEDCAQQARDRMNRWRQQDNEISMENSGR